MKKLFEAFTGLIVLLLIISAPINGTYLFFFFFGVAVTLVLTIFTGARKIDLVRWIIPISVFSACAVFVIWIINNLISSHLGILINLSMIGGALFPSIAAIAYLERRE